jgi:hypothetical protein
MAGCRDRIHRPEAEVRNSAVCREGQLSGRIAKADNRPRSDRQARVTADRFESESRHGVDMSGEQVARPFGLPFHRWFSLCTRKLGVAFTLH